MKQMLRIIRMLKAELFRMFCQPWFWLAAAGITLADIFTIFGEEDVIRCVFLEGNRTGWTLVNIFLAYLDENILRYAVLCLTAFPVVGNYVEDVKYNRMGELLTRISCWGYAVVQVFVVLLGAFFCLFLGDAIFLLGEHLFVGIEIATEKEVYSDDVFLRNGHAAVYLIFWELVRGMKVSACAMMTLLFSVWIKEKQFLVILPVICHFLFAYWIVPCDISWQLRWITPRMVYYHMALFTDNCVLKGVYALGFTLLIGFFIALLLWRQLKRRRRT